ncbi:hypothetical protein KOR34_00400 [Posidoniimonas corsicana]|uniref:Type II secretion system protein J n=1 Tax=Posidoniimonas corsicana TaxID=1938618 RepID=A0A5C5VAZ9_9BACT|nr:type II secretion system protein GspJ [Posidoniimonas corsicana]TWT35153.1 hypothetical protein KOR34_00400 [Posidoniimonas corsicana]
MRPSRPRGFTLLEVLLAIALSTVLLALLANGISMYLLRVDGSRGTVEQAQLARGVLRAIADDIRSVAVIYEQDISSAEATAESQALFDVDEADAAPPGGGSGGGGGDDSGSGMGDTGTTDALARPYAGVSGDAQSLQVDVRRIRPAFLISADTPDQPLTVSYDSPYLTTVRYHLQPEGLVREQLPRDRRIFEENQGRDEAWLATRRVLAAEVEDLRFRYHDGEQILDYWDIDEQSGALPVAVQVTLGFRVAAAGETTEDEAANAPLAYYSLTIPMPPPLEDAAAAAGGEDSSMMGAMP